MRIYKQIRLIYLAAGISIAVLVVFGLLYMEQSRTQVQYIDAVEHTYQVLSEINLCEKNLLEAETAQRGHILTGDQEHIQLFESALPRVDSSLAHIDKITADNPKQKAFFFQLKKFVTARMQIMKENLTLKITDTFLYETIQRGAYVMDNCRIYMSKIRAVEENSLQEKIEKKNKFQRLNFSYFKSTFIIACLICLLAIGVFFRELDIRLNAQRNLKGKINELRDSKNELEEITFAASHDLQEPMRKVRILSTMITKKFTSKLPEADLEVVYRINKITEQMHGLLNDLVLYTDLLNPKEKFAPVNLQELFKAVYGQVFTNQKVEFSLSPDLPVIHGSQSQLETMLTHLFENALKFRDPKRDLILTINYEIKAVKDSKYFWDHFSTKKYHQVSITDNGIGFDKEYSDKIFGLFQRLHSQTEYPGKGIGLSIARRVMSNHKGYISSIGEKKVGACFILYFPDSSLKK